MCRSLLFISSFLLCCSQMVSAAPALRVGAASIDITPERYPVIVNCSFVENTATAARDRLHARALVLDDGSTKLALVIVDSCMMPREFIDPVKTMIAEELQIPTNRQMIAATHTHTAPAVMGCLGSDPDPIYGAFLERQLVQVVRKANQQLVPAKVGWATVNAAELTNNRRWILRSDKIRNDPFGNPTVRANMHPGYLNADFVGPSGPIDPWLSVISVRTLDDKPLAVLSNFSMHYYGTAPVSADYYGKVCQLIEEKSRAENPKFVAMHSQGTSGDLHWMDYGKTQNAPGIERYSQMVAERIQEALKAIKHESNHSLAMAEKTITLGRRLPDAERLKWAHSLVNELKGQKPKSQPEIYAREAVFLSQAPRRELKIQAIRIGDLGMTALPNEVYALSGLKLRAMSPLPMTFQFELANGAEGYIPPPEQHTLGGYTTWPARTAGLEVDAEPRIVTTALELLSEVSGKPAKALPAPGNDPYAARVLQDKPAGYWRLGELSGSKAIDSAGNHDGVYEPGVVFGLDGPISRSFEGLALVNRATHFSGGRLAIPLPKLGNQYSLECWIWNGFPASARDWTGTPLSLAQAKKPGDCLALGGKKSRPNVVTVVEGTKGDRVHVGQSAIPFREWTHVVWIRDQNRVRVLVNGTSEIDAEVPTTLVPDTLYVGGRADGTFGWEGRLAEIALYPRILTNQEIQSHLHATRSKVR